ncbi:hypothetical protein [Microcoleus sp. herbarium12]|uniref:hypothetical protein n=1 Tax=Microcoleus sp. herbarium12 TaxID=3055437 RepID=UPI002FD65942
MSSKLDSIKSELAIAELRQLSYGGIPRLQQDRARAVKNQSSNIRPAGSGRPITE